MSVELIKEKAKTKINKRIFLSSPHIGKYEKKFIDEAYDKAINLLTENINKLHAVAAVLLEKEKIDGKEFEEIFEAN